MHEGIFIEVLRGDEGLEVGIVAGCCREGGVGWTEARWSDVADADVVVVPIGEHRLVLDSLGRHFEKVG